MRVGDDSVKYLKMGWNRKEGGETKILKGGGSLGQGGCLNLDKSASSTQMLPPLLIFCFKKGQTIFEKNFLLWDTTPIF